MCRAGRSTALVPSPRWLPDRPRAGSLDLALRTVLAGPAREIARWTIDLSVDLTARLSADLSVDLTVVANRLPVERLRSRWVVSPGGLVAALEPVMRERRAAWVGWPGGSASGLPSTSPRGIRLVPVPLGDDEVRDYYHGMSNGTLWPLFHDRIRLPTFHRHWWHCYQTVNDRFAGLAAQTAGPGGTVWVHDYQLALVPRRLRELRPDVRIGLFLHIPFPSPDLFAQLPWRAELLRGLLGADALGFQTRQDADHFRAAACSLAGAWRTRGGLVHGGRPIRVDALPIGIDTDNIVALARAENTLNKMAEIRGLLEGRRLFLGVDRMDYTKGIRPRLRAFETLLQRRPDLAEHAVFLQVAVPSREMALNYAATRGEIEQLVGSINGRYARLGRVPVQYQYARLDIDELVAYYRAADIMVVTPPRDGMNLVALEFVTARVRNLGVLILSEFAGAARHLRQALLVNPYDVDGVADAYERALDMPESEQRRRMRALRTAAQRQDVHDWARRALDAITAPAPGTTA